MHTPRQAGQTRRRFFFAALSCSGLATVALSQPIVSQQPQTKPAQTPASPAPSTPATTPPATIDLTDVITSVVLIRVKTDLGNGTVSISEGTGVYLGSGKVLTASHVVSAYTTIEVVFLPPPSPPSSKPTTPPSAAASQTTSPLKVAAGTSELLELPAPTTPAGSTTPGATVGTPAAANPAIVTVPFDPTKGKLLSYPTADVSLLTNIAAPAWAKPAKIAPRKAALSDATVSVGVQRDLVRRVRTGVVVDTTSSPHTFHATSASQKGDSGGPTFNARGEVVGILSGVMTAQWKRPDGSTFERTTSVSFNVAGMTF